MKHIVKKQRRGEQPKEQGKQKFYRMKDNIETQRLKEKLPDIYNNVPPTKVYGVVTDT